MLTSFRAQSFRCFRDLKIDRLGRVNLIVGKNGVGKTSLLEALWLYAGGGQLPVIREILEEREEFFQTRCRDSGIGALAFFKQIQSLFNGRSFAPGVKHEIILGPVDPVFQNNNVSLRLAWLEGRRDYSGTETDQEFEIPFDQVVEYNRVVPALAVSMCNDLKYHFDLNEGPEDVADWIRVDPDLLQKIPPFIRSHRPNHLETLRRWDAIALSDAEERITDCLKIVAPIARIISILDAESGREERIFRVRLESSKEPQPLKSLGCGIETLLETAVAVEYSHRSRTLGPERTDLPVEDGYFRPMVSGVVLIDEIESGIHYSVLGDYWKFLFNLAEKLDVQIFATTHSWECLEAFQQAATANENSEGMLLRLEKSGDDIKAVTINEEDLAGITRSKIEVR